MKNSYIVLILCLLCVFCLEASAQENRFVQFADKKYAEYSYELLNEYYNFWEFYDLLKAQTVILQFREIAQRTGRIEWEMQADYFELILLKKEALSGGNTSFIEVIQLEFNLLEKARKAGVPQVELKLRHDIIEDYWNVVINFELALEQCDIQYQRLQQISMEDIPEKIMFYTQVANIYYDFKDYPKAISYFEEILSEKDNLLYQWYIQGARNTLGLCYRYGLNEIDRSDSCFNVILQTEYARLEDTQNRDTWDGIAQGNLGKNAYLRGDYDYAISLLQSSLEKMIRYGDYGYAASPAIDLTDIYLNKNMTNQAKSYLDLAMDCYQKSPRKSVLPRIYQSLSKYYAATGQVRLSMDYLDLTVTENRKLEEEFSALQMMRVAQRKHLSEQQLKEEQLHTEKIRSRGYRQSLIIIAIALLLITGGLLRYFVLYRKNRAAYKALVRKSQEWAQVPIEVDDPNMQEKQDRLPDEQDRMIMKDIERLMLENKFYRDAALSLDVIAQKLGVRRHNVSMAINHCMKKSFTTFINEYRIKEAVQILSNNNPYSFTMESLGFDVGFNARQNFYRVFKKVTGLSPLEFRRNLDA